MHLRKIKIIKLIQSFRPCTSKQTCTIIRLTDSDYKTNKTWLLMTKVFSLNIDLAGKSNPFADATRQLVF